MIFNEDFMRMLELSQQGFYCSQILIMLGLEKQGKENPDLIASMAGLAGGLGFAGKNCGTLSGGACLLALYAGRGKLEEAEDAKLNLMINELADNPANRLERCPQILYETYLKVQEILTANGYTLEGQVEG
jgi:hypothetical protein